MSPKRVIGVDLGGTKIRAAAIDAEGHVYESHDVHTPTASQEELLTAIAAAIEPLRGGGRAIGIGVPSILDRSSGRSVGSTNIPLANVSLPEVLGRQFDVPVVIENDANVAALAEWKLGAGRGASDLVMVTLGTGVGGGVVTGGSLYRGWVELGHTVVLVDGPPCQGNCTGRGHLEALASGNAADRAAEKLWGAGATAELLVGRAEAGDADALEALARIGHLLGAGVGSVVNLFGVDLVVVGGGFGTAAAEFLFPAALESARREALEPARSALRIVRAELGGDAGVVGAGLLAFEALGE